jgi:hypothetical protein
LHNQKWGPFFVQVFESWMLPYGSPWSFFIGFGERKQKRSRASMSLLKKEIGFSGLERKQRPYASICLSLLLKV